MGLLRETQLIYVLHSKNDTFAFTRDVKQDLLSMTAIHLIRKKL